MNKIVASIGQFRADLAIVGLEFGSKAPLGGIGKAACAGALCGLLSTLPLVPLYVLPRLLPTPLRYAVLLGVAALDAATSEPTVARMRTHMLQRTIDEVYANN